MARFRKNLTQVQQIKFIATQAVKENGIIKNSPKSSSGDYAFAASAGVSVGDITSGSDLGIFIATVGNDGTITVELRSEMSGSSGIVFIRAGDTSSIATLEPLNSPMHLLGEIW